MKNKDLKKKKYHLKKKNLVLIGIIIVFFGCTIYFGIKVVSWFMDNSKSSQIMQEINDKVIITQEEESGVTIVQNEEDILDDDPYWGFIKTSLMDVDIESLKKDNEDTVGWLNVKGTNINYPFVKSKDNKYYLTHDFYKQYNGGGWVFLDYRNNANLSDKNNIIYAHGRANNTMFGSLKNILNSDWFSDTNNYVIQVSTEKLNTLWQVFSVYRILNTNDYIQTKFSSDEEFTSFTQMLLKRSNANFKTNVSKDDIILTLSTCYNDNEKVVLHAKLIKKTAL